MKKTLFKVSTALVAIGISSYLVFAKSSQKKNLDFKKKQTEHCKTLEKKLSNKENVFLPTSKSGLPIRQEVLEVKFEEECKLEERDSTDKPDS